jgi:hypothetical protein
MATWIECKSSVDGKPVFVNLDLIVSIREMRGGSLMTYPGPEGSTIMTAEPPQHLLAKQKID